MSKTVRNILIFVAIVIVGCCFLGLIGALVGKNTPDTNTEVSQQQATQVQPDAQEQDAPSTAVPEPATFTPQPPPPTPEPSTATPTPLPQPIHLSGSNDSIVDIDKWVGPAIIHIVANSESRHFAIMPHDENGMLDVLVNTTDPYDGIRPLDFDENEHTTRFEINATGNWDIEIKPLVTAPHFSIPGLYQDSGDKVIILDGGTPDVARINGNAGGRHFAVLAYGARYGDVLVNTTDPYDGDVIVDVEMLILEIVATGPWSIDMSTR